MKQFIKSLTPPLIITLLNKWRHSEYGWKGCYSSWDEVAKLATGYDQDKILAAVTNSALKVKNGEASYERDSVIFDSVQYSWPLLSGVLLSAVNRQALSVLDFGGSLGSTYFQNKKFLDLIENVSWSIVEQSKFVQVGLSHFANERLGFYTDVNCCIQERQPNVLLLSSVMQYIEKPYELLDIFLQNNFEYILIDRTPFSKDDKQYLKLQVVPLSIYEASYPCWFFSESYFMSYFRTKGYELVESFDTVDGESFEYKFKGMILKNLSL